MRSKLHFINLLVILLTFSSMSVVSAKTPKAGSVCSKVGIKQVHAGKTFTCVKSGQKKVWSKGVKVSSPELKPIPVTDFSSSDLITAANSLTDVQICKTRDLTEGGVTSNGFPRPTYAKFGNFSARLLLLPISFTDFPFRDSDLRSVKAMADQVVSFYSKSSYGRVSLTFEILEKSKWINMGRSAASYNLVQNKPQQNNEQVVIDALALADPSINFDLYDGVVFESGYFQASGGGQGFPGRKYQTKNGVAKGVNFEFGVSVGKVEILAHEIGHSLFALEDLYVFLNSNRPSVPDPVPAGDWDMMSTSALEFFAWNKLLMGWIDDSQVRCIKDQPSTTHYVESVEIASNKPKLVLINLQEGVTLAIESRSPIPASVSKGVLVYKIDSRISHGDGPITTQRPILFSGNSMSVDGWTIKALRQDNNGVLLQIDKGSKS